MAKVRIKRGTRAQIEAAATAGALAEGEPYLLTDEGRFAVGMGAGAFAAMAKQGEGSINAVSGFRNKIINGSMEIAQRGAVFPGVGAGVYCLDRWAVGYATGAVVSASQATDSLAATGFRSNLKINVTTPDTSIAPSDVFVITQIIEGANASELVGKTFVLSFWVRSSKTGTHCVAFRNAAPDRSLLAEYVVSAANTWERKSVVVSGGLVTDGTWDFGTGIGLRIGFVLACGSALQAAAGVWQAGNFIATENQVNCLDAGGNTFAITGVQLESGDKATAFEHRPYGIELALCQRYYHRVNAEAVGTNWCIGYASTATLARFVLPLPNMRVAPTALEQSGTASDYSVRSLSNAMTCSAVPVHGIATSTAAALDFAATGLTAGQGCAARPATTSAYLAWSAEL